MAPRTSTGASPKLSNIVLVFYVAYLFEDDVCSTFETALAGVIPVVKTSIAGTRIIGRLCAGNGLGALPALAFSILTLSFFIVAGNKNGLLLPHNTTDQGNNPFLFILIWYQYRVLLVVVGFKLVLTSFEMSG